MGHLSAVGYWDIEQTLATVRSRLVAVFGFYREPYSQAVQSLELNEGFRC